MLGNGWLVNLTVTPGKELGCIFEATVSKLIEEQAWAVKEPAWLLHIETVICVLS